MTRAVLLIGLGWLLLAAALGAAGAVRASGPLGPPLMIVVLTGAVLVTVRRSPGFRNWLFVIDARWFLALHLTRFVGAYFLYLYARGVLPYAFAVPGGWGDIIVATLAALLLFSGPPRAGWRRSAYVVWNVLGLVDILFVVATAGRLIVTDPGSMAALQRLPLSLLPTFLVPLIIASHVILGARLLRSRASTAR